MQTQLGSASTAPVRVRARQAVGTVAVPGVAGQDNDGKSLVGGGRVPAAWLLPRCWGAAGCPSRSPCVTRAPAGTEDNGRRWTLVDWESCCPSADRSGGIQHQERDPAWLSGGADI